MRFTRTAILALPAALAFLALSVPASAGVWCENTFTFNAPAEELERIARCKREQEAPAIKVAPATTTIIIEKPTERVIREVQVPVYVQAQPRCVSRRVATSYPPYDYLAARQIVCEGDLAPPLYAPPAYRYYGQGFYDGPRYYPYY